MAWMYDADPFTARKEVDDRQVKAAKKQEEASIQDEPRGKATLGRASHEFSRVPEVKMATSLRELVESAIKQVRIFLSQKRVLN
jgi:ATP-dependent RNA helicase DHX57